MRNLIKERIESWKQSKRFTAQNCINRQEELRRREERRQIEEDQRNLDAMIDEIQNRIHFVISQSFNQRTVIFQVNAGQKEMFNKVKDYFVGNGFNAFFQQLEELPVEVLVISWM